MAKHVTFAECTKADPSAFEFTYQTIPNSFLAANKDKLSRILPRYDTVFLVDDSTSMRLKDGQLQKARWTIAGIWLAVLAEIAAHYDRDGVDIYFFHSKVVGKGLRSKHDVLNLFKEVQHFTAGTPTKTSINAILHEYFRRYPRVKPLNLIIITDGAPNPFTEDPTSAIEDCMKKMDELGIPQNVRQVGFMFAQVGNDYGAEQSLRQLDDKYRNSRRDIVDTFKSNMSNMRWTEHDWNFDVVKLLLGAIDKDIDNTDQDPTAATSYYPAPTSSQTYQQPQYMYQQYGYPQQYPNTTYEYPNQPSAYAYQQSPPTQVYQNQQNPPAPSSLYPNQTNQGRPGANASYYNSGPGFYGRR